MNVVNVSQISSFSNNYNSKVVLDISTLGIGGFWLKEFTLPGLSLKTIEVPMSEYSIKEPDNVFSYENFNGVFFLDEDFKVHKILYDWLMGFKAGATTSSEKSNGSLMVLNNSMTSVAVRFDFSGLFPTDISPLNYNMYNNTPNTLSISFAYDNWTPNFKSGL